MRKLNRSLAIGALIAPIALAAPAVALAEPILELPEVPLLSTSQGQEFDQELDQEQDNSTDQSNSWSFEQDPSTALSSGGLLGGPAGPAGPGPGPAPLNSLGHGIDETILHAHQDTAAKAHSDQGNANATEQDQDAKQVAKGGDQDQGDLSATDASESTAPVAPLPPLPPLPLNP